MKPNAKTSRRVPEEHAATQEEIEAAIESLTEEEEGNLLLSARRRISVIGKATLGNGPEDLLQEAITATLEGKRRWNKQGGVPFCLHLIGAMRSISSHWLEQFDEDEASLETDLLRQTDEGDVFNPMLGVASETPSVERQMIVREQVERLLSLVSSRELATLIVEGMREGMKSSEIKELLELDRKQYETEMTWIRRKAREDVQRRGAYV